MACPGTRLTLAVAFWGLVLLAAWGQPQARVVSKV